MRNERLNGRMRLIVSAWFHLVLTGLFLALSIGLLLLAGLNSSVNLINHRWSSAAFFFFIVLISEYNRGNLWKQFKEEIEYVRKLKELPNPRADNDTDRLPCRQRR